MGKRKDALIADALHHLQELESRVHDGLPSVNDTYLRRGLLDQIFKSKESLQKALS